MFESKNYYVLWTISMCTTSFHSKLCKIILWYECTRIIWMDHLLQIICLSRHPGVDFKHVQSTFKSSVPTLVEESSKMRGASILFKVWTLALHNLVEEATEDWDSFIWNAVSVSRNMSCCNCKCWLSRTCHRWNFLRQECGLHHVLPVLAFDR